MNVIKSKRWNPFQGNEILKAVSALFSVNLFASFVGMAGSFAQGIFVSAEELGFFKQFGIITGYAFFLHLGVFHAIERLFPMYMGKGEAAKAKEAAEIGNAWMLIVCLPLSVIFALLSGWSFFTANWKSGLCWIVQIVAIWTSLYGGFLSATYRSGKEFQKMAEASIYNPILSLAAIPLYWFWPFVTMVIRNCTSVVSTIRLYWNRPVKVGWRWSFSEWLQMVREGLPLYTASYITTTGLDSFRGTLILLFLTVEELGYWSFAYMCILLVLQLPTSITAVYVPRIIAAYGASTRISDAVKIARTPIFFGFMFMLAVIPSVYIAIQFLMPRILPNYVGAIPLLYVLLLCVPLKLSDALNAVLTAMRRVKTLNMIALISSGIQVGVALLGAYIGKGIISFGWGFFAGYLVRTILLTAYLYNEIRKEKKME